MCCLRVIYFFVFASWLQTRINNDPVISSVFSISVAVVRDRIYYTVEVHFVVPAVEGRSEVLVSHSRHSVPSFGCTSLAVNWLTACLEQNMERGTVFFILIFLIHFLHRYLPETHSGIAFQSSMGHLPALLSYAGCHQVERIRIAQ